MWIGTNNDQLWLPGQCYNWIQLDLITYFINFVVEMGHIMNRYDFLEATDIIVINIWTDLNWYILQSVHIHLIISKYNLLKPKWVILSNVPTHYNLI